MDSLDFEQQLIGSMIHKGDHYDCHQIAAKLPAEAFSNFHMREIFKVICVFLSTSQVIDPFTLEPALPEVVRPNLMAATRVRSAANIKGWAKLVRQCWMLRKGAQDLKQAVMLLESANPQNLNSNLAEVVKLIRGLNFETSDRLPLRIGDMIDDYANVFESRMKGAESGMYLQTGIEAIDNAYGGFDRTDLIIIAGRPGMGKTELAIKMANAIGRQRGTGLMISMEMSDMQVVERHIADRGGLSLGALRNPTGMTQEDYTRFTGAIGTLLDEESYVLSGAFTVDEIIAQAEAMHMDKTLSFLSIDYLTLIDMPKSERQDLAIAEVTRKLKQFCLKNKVPVILLAQLNRNVDGRSDKRPNMGDLAGSSSIEKDADVIIFPYRDEVYNQNTDLKGIAEIIIGKYRSGEPKTFHMGWSKGHFVNIDQQDAARIYQTNRNQTGNESQWS
jgi:Replicative DNA helicase